MKFIEFKKELRNFLVFNISDIRKIEERFDLRRLSEWQNKGYIRMIRRGYYIFSDLELNESVLFLIANKIYSPSYISLEMAFSYYNLIPEAVYGITSVTSQKTNNFKADICEFMYSHLKSELMFGYRLIKYGVHSLKIAEIEKALLDYFYLNPRIKTKDDFASMRFNDKIFKDSSDKDKLLSYLKMFNNKRLTKRLERFLKYINYV